MSVMVKAFSLGTVGHAFRVSRHRDMLTHRTRQHHGGRRIGAKLLGASA